MTTMSRGQEFDIPSCRHTAYSCLLEMDRLNSTRACRYKSVLNDAAYSWKLSVPKTDSTTCGNIG